MEEAIGTFLCGIYLTYDLSSMADLQIRQTKQTQTCLHRDSLRPTRLMLFPRALRLWHNNSFSLTDVCDDPTVATCTFDPQWITLRLTDNITHLGTTLLSHIDWGCMMDYMLDYDGLQANWLPHKQKKNQNKTLFWLRHVNIHWLTVVVHCEVRSSCLDPFAFDRLDCINDVAVFSVMVCSWRPWSFERTYVIFVS